MRPRSQAFIWTANEGSLVTPHFCGCCGTRTENVLRHPRRLPHRNNSRLGLLRWGKVNQKTKSKSGLDFDSTLPSEQAEERVSKVEAFCEDVWVNGFIIREFRSSHLDDEWWRYSHCLLMRACELGVFLLVRFLCTNKENEHACRCGNRRLWL